MLHTDPSPDLSPEGLKLKVVAVLRFAAVGSSACRPDLEDGVAVCCAVVVLGG